MRHASEAQKCLDAGALKESHTVHWHKWEILDTVKTSSNGDVGKRAATGFTKAVDPRKKKKQHNIHKTDW